jgi:hypothetical protein
MKAALDTSTASMPATKSCVCCYTYNMNKKGSIPTPCCKRFVCGDCVRKTPRFAELCVLCQLPLASDLAAGDASSPPDYDVAGLPAYQSDGNAHMLQKEKETAQDKEQPSAQHYVRKEDSIMSLSLAYKVDARDIRSANNIFSDHLLQARSFVMIPGAHISLSPAPGEDEQDKVKLKRFMVGSKCSDYAMAQAYMLECGGDVADAIARYEADSRWTRDQHLPGKTRR